MTTELVPSEDIEAIVGVPRDRELHYGRAVSSEGKVYILHSQECVDRQPDLRECRFSLALTRGILREPPVGVEAWRHDVPVRLRIVGPYLWPFTPAEEADPLAVPMARLMPRLEDD